VLEQAPRHYHHDVSLGVVCVGVARGHQLENFELLREARVVAGLPPLPLLLCSVVSRGAIPELGWPETPDASDVQDADGNVLRDGFAVDWGAVVVVAAAVRVPVEHAYGGPKRGLSRRRQGDVRDRPPVRGLFQSIPLPPRLRL